MNTNDLFSTPDQGRRLKELVPSLTSVFVWHEHPYIVTQLKETRNIPENSFGKHTYTPALTLQELRDVANQYPAISCKTSFYTAMSHMTAPELAAWVIERLEEVER